MLQLIVLSNPQLARAFVNYMQQQNIKIIIIEQQDMFELWLYDEAQLDYTRRCLREFLSDPYNQNYQSNQWKHSEPFHSSATPWWQLLSGLLRPVGGVTFTITLACVLIYIVSIIFGINAVFEGLHYPLSSQKWEIWRYITPIFLHFSVAHILFNLMWCWYLGDRVERYKGKGFLLLFILMSGFASNYFQSLIGGVNFGGLSGVIYGLLGYTWVMGIRHPQQGIYLEKGVFVLALIWLLFGFTRIFGPLANTAHAVGFIVGILLGYFDIRRFRFY